MQEKLFQKCQKKNIWKTMCPGILLSLAACFMLFLFGPLEIYINNTREFWYDISLLLPYCLIMTVVAFLGSVMAFLLAYLCGEFIYNIALGIYFAAFAGCYIQGNFLVSGLPPFDGTEIVWSNYRAEQIKSAVTWLTVALLVALLAKFLRSQKFRILIRYTSLFMFLMLCSTLAVLLITGDKHKEYLTCIKDNQFEMSSDNNFIILMLDAIDAGALQEVWEQHPEYEELLSDFTFYDDVLSGYSCTDCAQSLLLSGEWYENKEPFEDYLQRVYSESAFFENLKAQGYQLSIYDSELQLQEEIIGNRFDNMIHTESILSDHVLFLKRQIKLVGIKYAPYVLKPYCWFDAHKLWNQRILDTDSSLFFWENAQLYNDLQTENIRCVNARQFKYIHLEGAHAPFVYGADVKPSDDADYHSCIEASMTVTLTYLEKLRAAGVYDNSIIIILSDHGLSPDPDSFSGRQHSILFVKGLHEKHDFQISHAPISHEDFVGAYDNLLDGKMSDSIFENQDGERRERRYLLYAVNRMGHMVEYMQTGYAGDETTLLPTGRVFDDK